MLDDEADELFVDLAADQTQDFAPVVVAAVFVELSNQVVDVERLFDVEAVHEVGRAEILQKRAMDEGVTVRAQEAEDEVALAQLPQRRGTARSAARRAGSPQSGW